MPHRCRWPGCAAKRSEDAPTEPLPHPLPPPPTKRKERSRVRGPRPLRLFTIMQEMFFFPFRENIRILWSLSAPHRDKTKKNQKNPPK